MQSPIDSILGGGSPFRTQAAALANKQWIEGVTAALGPVVVVIIGIVLVILAINSILRG